VKIILGFQQHIPQVPLVPPICGVKAELKQRGLNELISRKLVVVPLLASSRFHFKLF
jgi:hypothetical protein